MEASSTASAAGGDNIVLLDDGEGSFEHAGRYQVGQAWLRLCSGDFDLDGDTDIAAALYSNIMTTLNRTTAVTAIKNETVMPASAHLSQNFPNPFNPSTTFRFSLPAANHVRIAVYDVAGRRVAVVTDSYFPAGGSEIVWNGRNEKGKALASGVYFARMTVDGATSVKKLILSR